MNRDVFLSRKYYYSKPAYTHLFIDCRIIHLTEYEEKEKEEEDKQRMNVVFE